jgi:hypothetical protein
MANDNNFSESLKWFGGQSTQLREKIVVSLEQSGPAITIETLTRQVADSAGIDLPELYQLKSFIESVASVVPMALSDKDILKSIVDICIRMAKGPTATSESHPDLGNELSRVFRCEQSIGLTGKAQDIIWGHGKVFSDAHVISQIRPLFRADIDVNVGTAVIVHELRVNFRHDEKTHSICFVMDKEKVEKLQQVLERAIQKERSLRKSQSFNYLTADGD